MEYAYAKLQGLNGQSFYIQHLPTKLCRKIRRDKEEVKSGYESIYISDSHGIAPIHSLVGYDDQMSSFFMIPFGDVYVDNQFYKGVENADAIINDFFAKPPKNIEAYEQFKIKLNNYSKIFFPSDDTEIPLVFYLILPKTGNSTLLKKEQDSIFTPSKLATGAKNKIPDKLLSSKWSMDDKEQLKKFILIYGYGRWKQIQEASRMIGGKLKEKPISEIRGFANAFIRCIVENLNYEKNELRKFLLSIIEEHPDDPYILVNSKDWDVNLIRQRANPWAKRIQLNYRVRMLIKKFKEEQRKNPNIKKSKDMAWENLLNFLPSSVFYGQRPSVWWTKKHDVDLLRGTYKYGYANYPQMKADPEYSFNELEKTSSYTEFPNADTITRRLKKLIQAIVKLEQSDGKLDFEGLSENELEGWETEEKKKMFKFLTDYGVPLNSEGKSNWLDLRERFSNYVGTGQPTKNINEIEKFVQKIRIKCQQVIESFAVNKGGDMKDENDEFADVNITYEDAQRFNKNTNILQFIRKNILSNGMALFKSGLEELVKVTNETLEGKPGWVPPKWDCAVHDKGLLQAVSDNGFHILEKISGNVNYGFEGMKIPVEVANQRLEFVCEFYKNHLDKTTAKKRKSDKPLKDETKKKQKFTLNKDETGNIIFPLVINNSLTLLDCGVISTNPNYHSEHNLFPIGYKSVRTYASMFERGKKAQYTCEILEGPEGKPLYRVTSSEDPNNPIVRDSSTGCWVYICSKVNDLAEVKKQKVTISGTERFGLLEANVCRILENLPNAEKCTKYKFKYRVVNQEDDEDII